MTAVGVQYIDSMVRLTRCAFRMQSGIDEATARFLGPRGLAAVASISGTIERNRIVKAIGIVTDALLAVDRLDLTPYELSEDETPSLAAWNALAPSVKEALVASHRAVRRMQELFPTPPTGPDNLDMDVEEAMAAWEGFDLPDPIRDQRDAEIDEIIAGADGARSFTGTIPAVSSLLMMLEADIVAFGERLRNPRVVADRWFLLGELYELKSKCSQALEAVVATLLGPHTQDDVQLVLPRFAGAAKRAAKLRTAIVDLSYDVEQLEAAVQSADVEAATEVRHTFVLRLKAFSDHPAYRFLRPMDRREVLKARIRANQIEIGEHSLLQVCREFEGFSKFLEVMRNINDREVLEHRDRAALLTAQMLLESDENVVSVLPLLEQVYGRDRDLDFLVRGLRRREPIDGEVLLAKAQEILARLT